MPRSRSLSHVSLIAICTLLGCTSAAPQASTSQSRTPTAPAAQEPALTRVAMADQGIVPQAPVYVALDRGYFRNEGLDLALVPSSSTGESAALLVSSQVELGAAAPDPALFNAMERGVEVKLLASGGQFLPGTRASGVVVRQDLLDSGRYRAPSDLKGLKIAVASVQSQFYVEQILAQAGLGASDVEFSTLALPHMSAALQNQAIDAGWIVEPMIGALQAQGLGTLTATGFEAMPNGTSWVVFASPTVVASGSDTAVRFMRAYLRGLRDFYHAFGLKDAPTGPVLDALAAHSSINNRSVLEKVAMHTVDPNGALDIASLDRYQEYYIATGNQTRKIDLTRHTDPAPLETALGALGRVP